MASDEPVCVVMDVESLTISLQVNAPIQGYYLMMEMWASVDS